MILCFFKSSSRWYLWQFLFVSFLSMPFLLSSTTSYAAELGRPRVEGNTFVASDGSRLRGGTFWIFGQSVLQYKTTFALSSVPWDAIKQNKFNVIRIACGYYTGQQDNYTFEKYGEILDSLVSMANRAGVYAVIDFHDKPGTYNVDTAAAFWKRFAPRYKDHKNVIFELTNEPKFDQPASYTPQMLRDFEKLWGICNSLAPDNPVIILTFNAPGYSGAYPAAVADSLRGIDWTKTAVGFHSYWSNSSVRIVDLKGKYPCMNTEFMCQTEGSNEMKVMDGYAYHGSLMETLGISWLQWDIMDRPQSITDKLPKVIQDLKDKNLFWGNGSIIDPGNIELKNIRLKLP